MKIGVCVALFTKCVLENGC